LDLEVAMASLLQGLLAPESFSANAPAVPPEAARARAWRAALFLTALLGFWVFAVFCLAFGANNHHPDEADGLLEAHDMAQGNLFLSGWVVNGDSFYATYVPLGAALIRLFGYSTAVMPVASFLFYIMLVTGALLVAWRRGVSRGSVAVVLFLFLGLLTPFQSYLFLFFMSHTGTIAYALFALAALRAGLEATRPAPRAAWITLFGLFLLAAGMADPFVNYFCVLPLLAAGLLVVLRAGGWKIGLAIAGTAIGAVVLAKLWVHFLGTQGFTITPVQASFRDYFAPLGRLPTNFRIYGESLQVLAVAYLPGWPVASVLLTMLRIGTAGWAIILTAKQLFSRTIPSRTQYYIDAVLLVGVVIVNAEFVVYSWIFDTEDARYLFPGVVFTAILAARRLAPVLDGAWRRLAGPPRAALVGATAVGMLLALEPLGHTSQAPVDVREKMLVRWLWREDLTSGYAAYRQSNVLRAVSAEQIHMAPVCRSVDLKLSPYLFLAKADWFNEPKNFLVYEDEVDLAETAVATLGRPNEVRDVAGYHVLIWNHDIHRQLEAPSQFRLSFPLDLTKYALSWSPDLKRNADGSFTDEQVRAQPAILVFGPYLPLPAGQYTARFTLRADAAAPTDALVLDVASHRGAEVDGKIKLTGAQLPGAGVAQTFTVAFTSHGPEQSFEFRVWKTGRVKLTIAGLKLEKAAP